MANSTPVQSIDRVFDIVEALSSSPHGMSLTDLAAAVGLHVSTVHRLLASLSSRGYVQKDIETGKYRLTLKMFEVGSRAACGVNLVSIARPYLERLAEFSGEAVHLVARMGDEVVYLYKEDTSSSIARMASFVGLKNPMYCTGVGKCILANLPPEAVRGIWDRSVITAFTPNTITDLDRLTAELKQIKAQGYALDNEEHEPGVFCIAAPIFDYSAHPVAAISVSAPASRMEPERIKEIAAQVVSSAGAITGVLGG